jgi:ubiquinone biosynthesis protein
MFKKRLYHLNRYREIATALAKNGFGFILHDVGLLHVLSLPKRLRTEKDTGDALSRGKRLREVIEELGPTFIKLGQLLSVRPDLIPVEWVHELEHLQDDVHPFSTEEAKRIVRKELHDDIDVLFSYFEDEPLAAGSIGQVHRAKLRSGRDVVVKVRRPGIVSQVETDLEILRDLANLAEQHYNWAKRYQMADIVEELSKSLRNELKFGLEGRNSEKIRRQFSDDPYIVIPEVCWEYSTDRVLTSTYIEGKKGSQLHNGGGFDSKLVADRLVRAYLDQVLFQGFFHGDPHPGNVFFLPDNRVAFIDFGQVGSLNEEMRDHLGLLIISLMRQNTDGVIQATLDMAAVPNDVDLDRLRIDVDLLRERYYDVPLHRLSIGEAVRDLFSVVNLHGIRLPKDYTLMAKGMLTIESIAEKLDPELSIMKLAEPYGKKLLQERYNPKNVGLKKWREARQYKELLFDLPHQIRGVLQKVQDDQLKAHISLPEINIFLRKLDRASNRISFSVTLLAFSIIILGLIVGTTFGHEESFLTSIPTLEIGFVVAFFMFVWIIFSILKSGRM